MKTFVVKDDHNLSESPVFISKEGKIIGMIKRSDFNYLYPVATDSIREFDSCPRTLSLTDLYFYLVSRGYELLIQ